MQTPKAARHRLAVELPWHFLWAADEGDRQVADKPWPPGFVSTAEALGWRLPARVPVQAFDAGWIPQPFVWTRAWLEAVVGGEAGDELRARVSGSRWAGRTLCRSLQIECFDDPTAKAGGLAALGDSRKEKAASDPGVPTALTKLIDSLPLGRSWVFKGEWGFGGLAQSRFSTPVDAEAMRRLRRLWKAHGGGVVERLDAVAEEYGVIAGVRPGPQGKGWRVEEPRLHRLLTGKSGEFMGATWASDWSSNVAKVFPGPGGIETELRSAAFRIGAALAQEGFRGHFAFDAYTFRDPNTGAPCLRPLVDLNPRPTLALPLHGLARRLQARHPGPLHMRWRFLPRSRLSGWRLTDSGEAWFAWAGDRAYRPGRERGWIPGSPWVDGMERFSLAVVGRNAEECEALESEFLERAHA